MMLNFFKLLFRKHQIPLAETELFFRVLAKGKVALFPLCKIKQKQASIDYFKLWCILQFASLFYVYVDYE
jgi:hypothetical protein